MLWREHDGFRRYGQSRSSLDNFSLILLPRYIDFHCLIIEDGTLLSKRRHGHLYLVCFSIASIVVIYADFFDQCVRIRSSIFGLLVLKFKTCRRQERKRG